MPRRTQKQIELDCKRIQEAAKTATSMKEIEEATGLSQSEINTSLNKHPIISKRVRKQVEDNKAAAEREPKRKLNFEEKDNRAQVVEPHNDEDFKFGFVIDTSMVEVKSIYEMLCEICATEAKIILTSVVRQELNKMQFFKKDYKAKRARSILAMAAEKPEKFVNVAIDETLETHDDCIVKYCADNSSRVTLLTADKNMALDAREKAVKVEYFKQSFTEIRALNKFKYKKESDVRTLNPARKIDNKLVIMEMQGEKRDIRVLSKGQELADGIVEIKVGDEVLIAAKKKDCITFAHYKVINTYEEDNCKLIYSCRIYRYNQIAELHNEAYRSLARDFWNKHGLKK